MTERERVARAMVAASRPTADPDALTPAPRGMVGMVPIWQTFGHLADAAIAAMSPSALLTDPVAVHANMLAGRIAKPTLAQIVHLYGRDALLNELGAAWRPIPAEVREGEAPWDGNVYPIGRHVKDWGFVRGYGYWTSCRSLSGWVPIRGFSEVPGVLGLGNPTHYMPLPAPPEVG